MIFYTYVLYENNQTNIKLLNCHRRFTQKSVRDAKCLEHVFVSVRMANITDCPNQTLDNRSL